jgi:hypothetical protein
MISEQSRKMFESGRRKCGTLMVQIVAVSLLCVLLFAPARSDEPVATVQSRLDHNDFLRYLQIRKIDGERQFIRIEGRTARSGMEYDCKICELTAGRRSVTVTYVWNAPRPTDDNAVNEFTNILFSRLIEAFVYSFPLLAIPIGAAIAFDAGCIGTVYFDTAQGQKYGINITHNATEAPPGQLSVFNLESGEIVGTAKCEPPSDATTQ